MLPLSTNQAGTIGQVCCHIQTTSYFQEFLQDSGKIN